MDVYAYPFCLGRVFDTVEMDEGQYDTGRDIFWALRGAMFVRMSAIERTGLMDEAFSMHMEEIDLCWRLHLAGYRIVSVPESLVYHWGGFSLEAETFQRLYLKHRNSFIMMLKNWSTGSLIRTVPMRFWALQRWSNLVAVGQTLHVVTYTGSLIRRPRQRGDKLAILHSHTLGE